MELKEQFEKLERDNRKLNKKLARSESARAELETVKDRYDKMYLSTIRELDEKNKALSEARKAAEEAAMAKSAFLSNMSHEIRTPMNSILGFIDLVLEHELPEDLRNYLTIAHSSSENLLRLINDILDVSKLESGKIELETIDFNLKQLLKDVIDLMRFKASEKDLILEAEFSNALPLCYRGDSGRLRQVLLNLIGNAIKFTHQGGIFVSVEPVAGQLHGLHFAIRDTGIGMNAKQVENVFESFSQADNSIARRYGGTGLGTTICKQIVTLMRGEIWVESVFDVGSTFHFTVRLQKAEREVDCSAEKERKSVLFESPRVFNILLAEDIEVNATLAMLRFKQQGHQVTHALNGQEAIELYAKESFDLILMDIMMPKMDGYMATRHIREREGDSGQSIPIIALTASIMQEDVQKCLVAGMNRVVGKPVNFKELFLAMEEAVPLGCGKERRSTPLLPEHDEDTDMSCVETIVDVSKGMAAWGNSTVYAKALKCFIKDHSSWGSKLLSLLDNEDLDAARSIAHALKGVAGNLQISEVARIATEIDTHLKAGKPTENIFSMARELDAALDSICEPINRLNIKSGIVKGRLVSQQALDPARLTDLLNQAIEAFAALNPDPAMLALESLADYFSDTALNPIKKKIEEFDFDSAKSAVEHLKQQLKDQESN